jgi:hypothetical protein
MIVIGGLGSVLDLIPMRDVPDTAADPGSRGLAGDPGA